MEKFENNIFILKILINKVLEMQRQAISIKRLKLITCIQILLHELNHIARSEWVLGVWMDINKRHLQYVNTATTNSMAINPERPTETF